MGMVGGQIEVWDDQLCILLHIRKFAYRWIYIAWKSAPQTPLKPTGC